MGKIKHCIVNGYNLKTVQDVDMGFSDAYIACYGQYIFYDTLDMVPGVIPSPQVWEITYLKIH